MTQHRAAAWRCVVSLSLLRFVKKCFVFFQISRVLVGIPVSEAYQIKNEYAQRRRLRRMNSLPKVKFSRLERLYHPPEKLNLAFVSKPLDIWKKTAHFFTMRSKDSETTHLLGSGPMLRHNNSCVRDVLTASSNVYLNLGLNLFHSYF